MSKFTVLDMCGIVRLLTIPLLLALAVSNSSFAQDTGTSCVDTDGDGWGWDGTDSCRIQPIACVDTDGDGWGWDGADTCRLSEDPTPQPEFATRFCTDTDGDGWGWDGTGTCVIDQIVDNTCIDTDGDGWGWNGETSCFIDTQAGCIDTDGDGWGWNGYQTCLMSADTTNQESPNVCLINGASVNTALNQPQCDALLDIYTSTNGNNWDNNDQWISATDPCNWYGVNCNNSDQVDEILLGRNGLTGSVPATINQLQGLSVLELNDNDLNGPVPDLSATSIFLLDLANNRLTGSIPASLGSLPLVFLFLDNNQLTGSIPANIGSQFLDLSNNQLTGSIPAELVRSDQIILDLQNNLLSGSLDGISHAQEQIPGALFLSGNQCFTATDPDLISWLDMFVPDWDQGC